MEHRCQTGAAVDTAAKRLDVPLLVESMSAEMAGSGSLPHLQSVTDWQNFVLEHFSAGFGKHFPSEVQGLYGTSLPELAAYNVDSDTGNLCGLLSIAHAATTQSTSPVYAARVEAGPIHAVRWCDCLKDAQFPFH